VAGSLLALGSTSKTVHKIWVEMVKME